MAHPKYVYGNLLTNNVLIDTNQDEVEMERRLIAWKSVWRGIDTTEESLKQL